MDIVIDFSEYYLPNDKLLLKELAVMSLHPYTKHIFVDKHFVFKPPCLWETLPKKFQDDYLDRCQKNGILWQSGYANANLHEKILKEYCSSARRVYIMDLNKKNLLTQMIDEGNELILHEYTDESPNPDLSGDKIKIKCIHHQNRENDNCAYENAFKMKNSLSQYVMPENKYYIKELAILSLQKNANSVYIDKHYLFKSPFSWSKVPSLYQNFYLDSFEKHGIPWQLGYINIASQKSILTRNFDKAKRIYLSDNLKKYHLLEVIGNKVKKPILCLSDMDYFDIMEPGTKCNHHENRDLNYCVYDSALNMRNWLLKNGFPKKRYPDICKFHD
ncbi:hypothetical protein KQX54_007805 [Cotesia glomerata]|uniref:Uncharacterized protein n=1 Tax=Cotesia glomerata TaxID=32391 RepID=A0AAV7IJ58_COTGL|nr:hypothetical protein KQX54_007805 [Cotesia glomerata]